VARAVFRPDEPPRPPANGSTAGAPAHGTPNGTRNRVLDGRGRLGPRRR
jgi:hypothetical protein